MREAVGDALPLGDAFEIRIDDYLRPNGGIIFPNPNAPTGRLLPLSEIERLLQANPSSVVVVDEIGFHHATSVAEVLAEVLRQQAGMPRHHGAHLAQDRTRLHRPAGDGKYPVLLNRTPYGKHEPRYIADARAVAGNPVAQAPYLGALADVPSRIAADGISGFDLDLRLSAANVTLAGAKLGRTAMAIKITIFAVGSGLAGLAGALALAAVPQWKQAALARPVHLAFSYDEELDMLGARRLASHLAAITPRQRRGHDCPRPDGARQL